MRREHLKACYKPILATYLASFLMPVGRLPFPGGFRAFLGGLLGTIFIPTVLIPWSANVLFWLGLVALLQGQFGRATGFGVAATLATAPSILFFREDIADAWTYFGVAGVSGFAGLYVWMASIASLLAVGGLAMGIDETGRFRPRINLEWMVVAVVGAILYLGLWQVIVAVTKKASAGLKLAD